MALPNYTFMNKNLKFSGIAAIVTAVVFLPMFILSFVLGMFPTNSSLLVANLVSMVFGLVLSLLILNGYLILAQKNNLPFLSKITSIMIGLVLFLTIFGAIGIFYTNVIIIIISVVMYIIIGINYLLFGVAVRKLEKYKGLAKTLGVLYIIEGVLYCTVILFILIPITAIATSIIEAIIFSKAAKD